MSVPVELNASLYLNYAGFILVTIEHTTRCLRSFSYCLTFVKPHRQLVNLTEVK